MTINQKVGFVAGCFEDPSRTNWAGTGFRPIHWSAWYPTEDYSLETQVLVGPSQNPLFIMGEVARDAPLKNLADSFPVVLISHGNGGSIQSLGWLGKQLASHGYVAIGVNHHGNNAFDLAPEGAICWWERVVDLTEALNKLSTEGMFADRLNLDRVFGAGFSLGGYTILSSMGAITSIDTWIEHRETIGIDDQYSKTAVNKLLKQSKPFQKSWGSRLESRRDERICAGIICAPGPDALTQSSLENIHQPIEIVVGGADTETPRDYGQWLHRILPISSLTSLGSNVGHYVFLCEGTEFGKRSVPQLWQDAPEVERRKVHCDVVSRALNLFSTS